jgi:hypothetical protein
VQIPLLLLYITYIYFIWIELEIVTNWRICICKRVVCEQFKFLQQLKLCANHAFPIANHLHLFHAKPLRTCEKFGQIVSMGRRISIRLIVHHRCPNNLRSRDSDDTFPVLSRDDPRKWNEPPNGDRAKGSYWTSDSVVSIDADHRIFVGKSHLFDYSIRRISPTIGGEKGDRKSVE